MYVIRRKIQCLRCHIGLFKRLYLVSWPILTCNAIRIDIPTSTVYSRLILLREVEVAGDLS